MMPVAAELNRDRKPWCFDFWENKHGYTVLRGQWCQSWSSMNNINMLWANENWHIKQFIATGLKEHTETENMHSSQEAKVHSQFTQKLCLHVWEIKK